MENLVNFILLRSQSNVLCDKVIIEASNGVPGNDALQCEGACGGWMYRCCAGVSLSHYTFLSASEEPFYCAICCQQTMRETISSLRDTVNVLKLEIAQLKVGKSFLQSGKVTLRPVHNKKACRANNSAPSRRSVMPPPPSRGVGSNFKVIRPWAWSTMSVA